LERVVIGRSKGVVVVTDEKGEVEYIVDWMN